MKISEISENYTSLEGIQDSGKEYWSLNQIIISIVLGVICITTITSNVLVQYLFWNSKSKLKHPTHILLANLSLADLTVGVLVMPTLLVHTLEPSKWQLGWFLCVSNDYIHFALCESSMASVVAIALERFIGTRYPLRHKRLMTKRLVIQMIIGIWILAIVLSATPLTIWKSENSGRCFNLKPNFVLVISILVYWIPICLTILLYLLIFMTAMKPFEHMKLSNINANNESSSNTNQSSKSEFQDATTKQKLLTKKLSIVIGLMLITYGPLFGLFFIRGLNIDSPLFNGKSVLFGAWIRYFSSCMNPFIYAFAVPGYKKEFSRVFLNKNKISGSGGGVGTVDITCTFETNH